MNIKSLTDQLANLSFFSISLLLHVVAVGLLGTAVIFRQIQVEPPGFVSTDVQSFIADDANLPGPPAEEEVEFEEMSFSTEIAPASAPVAQLTALATDTATSSSSFSVNMAGVTQSMGTSMSGSGIASSLAVGTVAGGRGGRGGGAARTTLFGTTGGDTASGMEGIFYDLKQDRKRKPSGISRADYGSVISKFIDENFDFSLLKDFYEASTPLYANEVMIPKISATEAPAAFGVEKEVEPRMWVVVYRGQVTPPRSGTYRFAGVADDVIAVKLDGKVVLESALWRQPQVAGTTILNLGISRPVRQGPPVKLVAGTYYPIEILVGEQPGGGFFAHLMVEEVGASHKKTEAGIPILPRFVVEGKERFNAKEVAGRDVPANNHDTPPWKLR